MLLKDSRNRQPSERDRRALAKEFGISACGPLPNETRNANRSGLKGPRWRRRGPRVSLGLLLIASAVGVILGRSL
jgi:hypothetical protein